MGRMKGFSLLELAVIILILGMIIVLLAPTLQLSQQEKIKALRSQLERADLALTGYIMTHHRLPCPDTDDDGKENCGEETGALPYKNLGIADAMARRIRYGVLKREAIADPEAAAGV